MIRIDLPPEILAPPNANAEAEAEGNAKIARLLCDPYVEHMMKAVESPRGIAIDCADEKSAKVMRFRCYAKRRQLDALGVTSLRDILLRVRGSTVEIVKGPTGVVREL